MRVRGELEGKSRNKFIWHSCRYCKRAFPSKLEVIKHKREKHAVEMKISTQNTSIDSDDEPTVVIMRTVKECNNKSVIVNHKPNGDTSSVINASSPTTPRSELVDNSSSYCPIVNNRSNSPVNHNHNVDSIPRHHQKISEIPLHTQSKQNPQGVLSESGHHPSTRSQQQLLYKFLNENNNNSYTSRSKHKQQSQGQELEQKRQCHNSSSLPFPVSSTSPLLPSSPQQCVSPSRSSRFTSSRHSNRTLTLEKSLSSIITSSNVKGSSQQSNNCKVLRKLLNGYWDPPKLREYQRPSVITSNRHSKSTKSQIASPQQKHHNHQQQQQKTLACLICKITFLSKESLAVHLDSHLSSPSIPEYQCQICTKPFDSRESYDAHMELSTCRTNFLCPFCFLHFPNLQQLKCHESSAHGGKTPYSCKFCFLPFETVGGLMSHLVTHTIMESEEI